MEIHPKKRKHHEITACEKSEVKNAQASLDMIAKHFWELFWSRHLQILEDIVYFWRRTITVKSRHTKNQKLKKPVYLWLSDMYGRNAAMWIEKTNKTGC